jgi:hypothetical protein
MRRILLAMSLLTMPAMALGQGTGTGRSQPPDDARQALQGFAAVTILPDGSGPILTIELQVNPWNGTLSGRAWYDNKGQGAVDCGGFVSGTVERSALNLSSGFCQGRFSYKGGRFTGVVTVRNIGEFPAHFDAPQR